VIKNRLQDLVKEFPAETQQLLDSFSPPIKSEEISLEGIETNKSQKPSQTLDIYGLIMDLCNRSLIPSICFQLDSVRCRQLFDQLLAGIEEKESEKYPGYREKLEKELVEWETKQLTLKKSQAKSKSLQEENEREAQEFQEAIPPDVYAPHPDFVLTPPGYRLSAAEFKEIKWQLRRELSEKSDDGHPLVRSLRRGLGIYNENLPAAYLRIVQSLAQAGRLAVVFSDESLAYGVNMPFRTCCFCEDTSEEVLSSLMVQQMAGRAGRRGLDRQGNIVFSGMTWKRIQQLMRGLLPDVVGRKSRYPTMCIQGALSPHMTPEVMQRISSYPLDDYMKRDVAVKDDYLSNSMKWMQHLGVMDSAGKLAVDKSIARLIWEIRDNPAEALGIFSILELLYFEFQNKPGDKIGLQIALFNILLRVIGREKYHAEYARAAPLTVLQGQEEVWGKMTTLIAAYDAKVTELGSPESLKFDVDLNADLDGYVWKTVVDNLIPSGLETAQLNLIKKRMWHVGDRLRLMHNLLMYSGRYSVLEEIVRKCFRRIKWILIDSEV